MRNYIPPILPEKQRKRGREKQRRQEIEAKKGKKKLQSDNRNEEHRTDRMNCRKPTAQMELLFFNSANYMGTKFHVNNLEEQEVKAYRRLERERMEANLNQYIKECSKLKVTAEKLVMEMNDISQGILALIHLHGVTRLVMGAAADKHYSRKMKTPKSKKAIMVMDKADPLCKIWFVCKGALICTRANSGIISAFPQSPAPSSLSGSTSSVSDRIGALSPQQRSHEEIASSPLPVNWSRSNLQRSNQFTASVLFPSQQDNLNRPEAVGLIYPWEGIPKGDLSDPEHTLWTAHDELVNNPWPRNYRKEAMMHSSVPQESDDDSQFLSPRTHNSDGLRMDADMYEKYEEVLNELEAAKKEAFQESNKRRRAEMDLLSAHQKRERDDALNKLEENMQALQEMPSTVHSNLITNEFSYDELVTATRGFSEDLKIGEGNFGIVYRGLLRNTPVAVNVLHWDGMQGTSEFHREVAMLNRTRHPNLVTLIGTCSEAYALVYEYLPNGSLEDRLACSNNTLPLSWQARTRIIGEICSGLIFLHSSQPHPVVHGDLKLENILLTENLVSKISNFGICQRVIESNDRTTSVYRTTNTKSTLAYMNPGLISTGEVTTQTDVYSFGIIILRLLTGWQPLNISNKVEEAIQNGNMHSVIDPSAGEWPFVQASQLAHLGLRCIALSKMKCADLVTDVWQAIKTMMQVAALSACPLSFALASDDQHVPSYFICPIF
ncbi:U-box domain-containing protein kinase family protein [Rhynchospora pubera]|uniref:RING-type E3 ubiquitin transferase n=1 Tax=Rhynchospora pubera TaxID=906938 RepID=A0AAV8H792_9POAL|nr:U-box domain-containing protein kinase family protein [Rhynchospora pubera]